MIEKYYIEVVDDEEIYAMCEYSYKDMADVFNTVKSIINNYNHNLCTAELSMLPLAVRMLQVENERGTLGGAVTAMGIDSVEYIRANYPGFGPLGLRSIVSTGDYTIPLVSVHRSDRNLAVTRCQAFVEIDIENKTVNFHYFTDSLLEQEFNKWCPWTSFSKLTVADYSMDEVPFNALEDFEEFVNKNGETGWIDPYDLKCACVIEGREEA